MGEPTEPFDPERVVSVLGVRVHDVTFASALGALIGFIESGRPHRVITPNPEIVMHARQDPHYREVLNTSDLAIPDGIGLLFAARMAGRPLRSHVRGTDLVLRLAARSAVEGWRWFLLGAQPGVAEAAGTWLEREFSGLVVAGAASGSPDPREDAAIQRAICRASPVHVLLVAYGAPRQELWIARNQGATGVPVQIGVGGVLNFFAGRSSRAPGWVRRLELEWAYRLAREPWRWRRQLALPAFAVLAMRAALGARIRR
ncbi:MAG TPA: WecB/TagA/CpsF family glycosyltransferase [Chloroflexota bacterium]|nr:WecB/TagA/CpsF family glycosyltransferase [Chloroflexota bacterium]